MRNAFCAFVKTVILRHAPCECERLLTWTASVKFGPFTLSREYRQIRGTVLSFMITSKACAQSLEVSRNDRTAE